MRRVLLAALGLACTLRGDGELASESRLQDYFDAVEVFDNFTAEIVVDPALPVGNTMAVVVSGDANALDRLFVGVHGESTLSVGVDPNHLTDLELVPGLAARVPVLVRVYAANQASVVVSGGSGEITLVAHDGAEIVLGGASAAALTVTASDDATVSLAGTGPSLKISTGGAASVDAQGFRAGAVTVDAQGSGAVIVCSDAEAAVTGPGKAMVEARCG